MRQSPRRPSARLLDVVLVLAILVALGIGVAVVQKARHHLAQAQMALSQLEDTLAGSRTEQFELLQDPNQLVALQNTLATLEGEIAALDRLARPFLPLSPYLGWLPGIGGDLKAAAHLLVIARETTLSARTLSASLLPLAQQANQLGTGLGRLGPELVQGLKQARSQLESAQGAMIRAGHARAALDEDQLSSRVRAMVDRFDRYQPLLSDATKALILLPELLGADGPRTYLLLAQNNHELRATGGFISGVGLVRVDGGTITELNFQDSYTVDDLEQPHPPAPDALRRHMGADMLLIRDANWWPDFPTSAREAANLYLQDQGQPVDGAIAVDLTTLQLLLQALGPIQVPNYDKAVDSGNLESMIMTYWQAPLLTAPGKENIEWWEHRKDFAADLMAALLTHLTEDATANDLVGVARAISRAANERHLLVYVNNDSAGQFFTESGVDGSLQQTNGDYVMVVDSNVGFNKANPNVDQIIDYQVELDDSGIATAQLSLTYRHRVQRPTTACIHKSYYQDGYADLMERCYWDYLRVYLPPDTEVISVLGADEPAEVRVEGEKTVVSTFFLLETGQERQIQFVYRPGLQEEEGRYTLLLQKQPGTGTVPVRVRVALPHGAVPISVQPDGSVLIDGQIVWTGDLSQDRSFEIHWRKD